MAQVEPTLAEQVAKVPTEPGCYLWKDASGTVIYVGKAKNLRARMRQYVTLSDEREKIPFMMQVVKGFDYVVVGSEHEALVLERELIAQHHPYYNVDYKDDKSYPYIAVTESDIYPAIKYTREKHRKGTRYFGPYTDAHAARETIDILRKVVPVCIGTCAEWKRARRYLESHPDDAAVANIVLAKRGRPCFDYHVGRGPGVCCGAIDTVDYARNVSQVERFLAGNRSGIIDELEDQMREAAAAGDSDAIAEYEAFLAQRREASKRYREKKKAELTPEEIAAKKAKQNERYRKNYESKKRKMEAIKTAAEAGDPEAIEQLAAIREKEAEQRAKKKKKQEERSAVDPEYAAELEARKKEYNRRHVEQRKRDLKDLKERAAAGDEEARKQLDEHRAYYAEAQRQSNQRKAEAAAIDPEAAERLEAEKQRNRERAREYYYRKKEEREGVAV